MVSVGPCEVCRVRSECIEGEPNMMKTPIKKKTDNTINFGSYPVPNCDERS